MGNNFPVLEAVEYKDKALYETVKEAADKKFSGNSYVKNLWIIREYKKRGGKVSYEGKKPSNVSIKKQVKGSETYLVVSYNDEECDDCYENDEIYGIVEEINENNLYIPDESEYITSEQVDSNEIEAAEYQGKKVQLNKPFRTPDGPKKFAVYTKNENGKVVIVRFGDPNMEIKRDDPNRRRNFRARHNCQNSGPKWKARYWSCQWSWSPSKKVGA